MFCFSIFFSFERTGPAASMRPPLASFTSLLVPGCVQGAIVQLVCLCVFVSFVVFGDCESCTQPVSTNSASMEADEGERVGLVSSHAVSRWSRSLG